MKKLLLTYCLVFAISHLFSQDSLFKKSNWKEYFSFHCNKNLALASDRIYSINENAIFYLNFSDNSLGKISKMNGLSDVSISASACNRNDDVLLIGYKNGNIDIVKNGSVTNVPDFKNKLISNDKSIIDIDFLNNKAFISSKFGILVLNYMDHQIEDTYILFEGGQNLTINRLYVDSLSSTLYVATEKGIFSAKYGEKNLADYNNWSKITSFGNGNYSDVCKFAGSIIATKHSQNTDSVYVFNGQTVKPFVKTYQGFMRMRISENRLLFVCKRLIDVYDNQYLLKKRIDSSFTDIVEINDAVIDNTNILWFNDYERGLFKSTSPKPIVAQSPGSDVISSINDVNHLLVVTHGVFWRYYTSKISFQLSDNIWQFYKDWSAVDPVCLGYEKNVYMHLFAGTWATGLVEYDDWWHIINRYNTKNSILGSDYISDVKMDNNGNLIIYNALSNSKPFTVITKNNEWYSWTYPEFTLCTGVRPLYIDSHNRKWVLTDFGVLVFDDKSTPLDHSDDEIGYLPIIDNEENNFSQFDFSMAIDKNNILWVGTQFGIAYYPNADNLFNDSKPRLSRNKITVNGVVDYMLSTETINCIAVDAANRKWVGTNNGLFLISSDGEKVLAHYTKENSPLPSNNISALSVFDQESRLYIGTLNGLMSLDLGISVARKDFSEVKISPNPVPHTFTENIKIDGLVENTIIKIIDVNGELVYETKSEGGTAFWDGKNLSGNRVATGVYVVMLQTEDQSQNHISKIIFIN